MPYSISQSEADCDGYAVVKDSDGTVMGCHETEEDAQEQIAAIEATEAGRQAKSDIDTTPTEAMQDAARRGLEMHEEGKSGDGLEGATVREAQSMAQGEALTEAKVRKGNAFWGRNESYCNEDASDAQITSRLLWGGCDSIDWFDRKHQAFEEAERMTPATATRAMARADADDLSPGDRVRWDSSGGTAYGEIETKETSGTISAEPDGPDMEGTEGEPAFGVRVYQPREDGWEASDVLTVHRAGALTKIDSFPEERSRRNAVRRSWTAGASIRMSSDGERTTVQVMTEDLARDGMILRADGVDTSAYMQNPVVLWDHGLDPQRGSKPIARTVDMQRVDGGLRATLEWYDDDFSQGIRDQVRRGFLSAVSIGWRTLGTEQEEVDGRSVPVVTEADMTEFSFVGVPADAGALVLQRNALREAETLDTRIRDAVRDALAPLVEQIAALRSTSATPASATAGPAPSDSDRAPTGERSAKDVPDDEPRHATAEDYRALAESLAPVIRTHVHRALGKQ